MNKQEFKLYLKEIVFPIISAVLVAALIIGVGVLFSSPVVYKP